jgi:hypothetical protein
MQLFHESWPDALKEVITTCGGTKQVAAKLWPEKAPDAAHRLLLDCLNESRPERLDPDRLRMVMRIGRQAGCHSAINWLLRDLGYEDAKPIKLEDARDALLRDYIEATKALRGLADRIEKLDVDRA